MTTLQHLFGETELGLLDKIAGLLFGEDVMCDHGLKGSDGVCPDCCNDMFRDDPEDAYAEVIDFQSLRETM